MLSSYRTPGVYYEWLDKPPALVGVRTDIAGFVGITERGPLYEPMKIESWVQFNSIFGNYIPQGYLAYAVAGFFANGGLTCWVVRVADDFMAEFAGLELVYENKVVTLQAQTAGGWGCKLAAIAKRSLNERFTLTLKLSDGTQEIWRDVTIDDPDKPRYLPNMLNDSVKGSQFVKVPTEKGTKNLPQLNLTDLEFATYRSTYLETTDDDPDGLKNLRPEHFLKGLAKLEEVDDVSMVAIPDIMPKPYEPPSYKPANLRCHILEERPFPSHPKQVLVFPREFSDDEIEEVQHAMIRHCHKLKDRVTILDSRIKDTEPPSILDWRRRFDSRYAALYYPWIHVPAPLRPKGSVRLVPPSGHVAGIFARVDRQIGVHKPPANELLAAVQDVQVLVNDIDHGRLNDAGINLIRAYSGRGIRVAGARTLSRDNEWRFLNVRRLFIMIGETLDEQLNWTVFEPNNRNLWDDIARAVRSFLNTLWQQGKLDGSTPEEAYQVICNETTNPPSEIEQGRVICEIGVQPPWPAEFVIVRIGKTEGGLEILE